MNKKILTTILLGLSLISLSSCNDTSSDNVNIDIYSTNDFHGSVKDSNTHSGIEKTSSYLKTQMKNDTNPILLSQGDMWQGSSESNNTKGMLVTEWMNDLGFSSMTLGNHEYDWGEEFIKQNEDLANFPFLGINIFDKSTNERVDYCKSSTVIEKSGLKIGVIGAIGDCYSSISGSLVENVKFKVKNELTDLVKNESKKLKSEGVDFIIYSIHDSNEAYDIELSNGYVDLVLEGHSHQAYVEKDKKGIYHVQTGGNNQELSHIDINYNKTNKKLEINNPELVKTTSMLSLANDNNATNLFTKYKDMIGDINKVLGYNSIQRDGKYLKQLVADLYLEKGLKTFPDYDIVLGGGYISCRNPYRLNKGDVTMAMLQTLFPFDNDLCLCKIKGDKLLDQFINSTNNNYYIALSEYGKNIKNSINRAEYYYILIDTYSSDYKPNGCEIVAKVQESGLYSRDLLAEYIKDGGLE